MDWFELLLVVIFFGAPLLGRIFKGNAPPENTLPPIETEGHGTEPARIPAPAEARQGAPATAGAGAGGAWSAGWGEWPGMETAEDEEEAADEEREAMLRAAAPEEIHTWEAVSLEPVAPVLYERPLPTMPASLELVEVDRKAEHARLHRRFEQPVPPPRPRLDRLADHLRSRDELRRAVLLAEVLAPPRSLRPLEGER